MIPSTHVMIERRYGPNRDWLCARTAVDCEWTCGVRHALTFASRDHADRVLTEVRAQSRRWPNADRFSFAVILDRSQLPSHFQSTDAPI
jgi:hypothetical protein